MEETLLVKSGAVLTAAVERVLEARTANLETVYQPWNTKISSFWINLSFATVLAGYCGSLTRYWLWRGVVVGCRVLADEVGKSWERVVPVRRWLRRLTIVPCRWRIRVAAMARVLGIGQKSSVLHVEVR